MRRAFVLQLSTDTTVDRWDGRIAHVDSGRSERFHSIEDAIRFVREILIETEQDRSETEEDEPDLRPC